MLVVLAACHLSDAELVRVDLEDGAYVRGVHVVRAAIGEDATARYAVGARLFIDRELAASTVSAPFDLAWDTTKFADGKHDIQVQLQLTDGMFTRTLAASVDNTPPEVLDLQVSVADQDARANARDNLGIARIEVSRVGEPEPEIVAKSLSTALWIWAWPCGPTEVEVAATDFAGNVATRRFAVNVPDSKDIDCDGFRSLAAGGDDCNDASPFVHPGASEVPEGFDANCDGDVESLAGIDNDGDGVRSFADGGDDCNDLDPSVHGASYAFEASPVRENGEPVTWAPGDASVFYEYVPGESRASLAVLRGERVTWTRFLTGQPNELITLASDANAGAISLSWDDYLAYGSGDQVVLLHRVDGTWRTASSFDAGGHVDRVRLQAASDPTLISLAMSVEGQLRVANFFTGDWEVEDLGLPAVSSIDSFTMLRDGWLSVAVRTGEIAWRVSRPSAKSSLQTVQVNPSDTRVTAFMPNAYPGLVAVAEGMGSRLISSLGAPSTLLETSKPIIALVDYGRYVLAQLEGGEVLTLAYNGDAPMRVVGSNQLARLDTSWGGTFAGAGFVYAPTWSSISPALDVAKDGRDNDCDGRD